MKRLVLIYLAVAVCNAVEIVNRAGWGGAPPKARSSMRTPVSMVFIHHTAGNRCFSKSSCSTQMRNIQRYHMNTRGWSDIGYSFLVGEDGRVYEGRGWNTAGAHTYGYNSRSIGIAFMGNFMYRKPGNEAINAAKQLISKGKDLGYLSRTGTELFGHRDTKRTSCPGNALYNEIQRWSGFSFRRLG